MNNIITEFIEEMAHNTLIDVVVIAIACDVTFGLLAALKERRFDGNKGIDGIIRKVGMIISLIFTEMADMLLKINVIAFIPEEVRTALGLTSVGLADFFSLLYILFEATSILKNMYLCGLPVGKIYDWIKKLSEKYTQEKPEAPSSDT